MGRCRRCQSSDSRAGTACGHTGCGSNGRPVVGNAAADIARTARLHVAGLRCRSVAVAWAVGAQNSVVGVDLQRCQPMLIARVLSLTGFHAGSERPYTTRRAEGSVLPVRLGR